MPANLPSSLSTIKTDPLRNFKFLVNVQKNNIPGFSEQVGGVATMGFMSVSGLNVSTEVIPYREGGMNTTTQKMPGQTDFSPITLTRGLAVGNNAMMRWMEEMFAVVQGDGTGTAGQDFRANIDVRVLAHPVTQGEVPIMARFKIYNAWPTSISFSDFDAGANAIVIQQMTLAHEGFRFRLATGPEKDAELFTS